MKHPVFQALCAKATSNFRDRTTSSPPRINCFGTVQNSDDLQYASMVALCVFNVVDHNDIAYAKVHNGSGY